MNELFYLEGNWYYFKSSWKTYYTFFGIESGWIRTYTDPGCQFDRLYFDESQGEKFFYLSHQIIPPGIPLSMK